MAAKKTKKKPSKKSTIKKTVAKKKVAIKKSAAKKPIIKKSASDKIEKGKVVSLHYSVRDESKKIVETSKGEEPLVYLHGYGEIISGLEKGLKGKASGDKFSVKVGPKDGYGVYDKSLIVVVERSKLSGKKNLKIGDIFRFGETDEDGRFLRITKIAAKDVTLDGNHPFAGKTLTFEIEVLEVRKATAVELEHNHAHPHGCVD